jgi:hypothetical protein
MEEWLAQQVKSQYLDMAVNVLMKNYVHMYE